MTETERWAVQKGINGRSKLAQSRGSSAIDNYISHRTQRREVNEEAIKEAVEEALASVLKDLEMFC